MLPDQLTDLLADVGQALPRPRVTRVTDDPAVHQIDLQAGAGAAFCSVGCTCGAAPVQLRYDAPDAETAAVFAALDHRPPLTDLEGTDRG